jgi:hypothetical protein
MTKSETISIEGQDYDSVTGLPVSSKPDNQPSEKQSEPAKTVAHPQSAAHLHALQQRSKTLRRQSLVKPVSSQHTITKFASNVRHMDIARPAKSANVHKFAPHPVGAVTPKSVDIGPVTHPHVAKAHALSAAKANPSPLAQTMTQIKDEAIKHAMAETHKRRPLKDRFKMKQRMFAVLTSTFAIVLLGGYFTYLNMPALSVRVAAAQAGIDANYPNYRPDGYALNGPVSFSDGRVSMNFKANGSEQNFTVNQSKSGWDSNAVLDNYVSPKAGSNYIPYTERGLTIYTYGDDAAWVNGGILYTIEGNAPLSSQQLRRIATSLL